MNPVEVYPWLRAAHIGLVLLSGSVFALRGLAVLAGARWAMARPLRLCSVAIDSALLAAALGLLWALAINPFGLPWLATKLTLLPLYIVLGSLALKRARSRRARAWSYVAALLCFGFMIAVARSRHPLGGLQSLWG